MVTGGGTVSPAGVPGPGVIASNAPGCVTTATPTPGPDTAGLPPQRRATENRRVSVGSPSETKLLVLFTVSCVDGWFNEDQVSDVLSSEM